MQIDFYCEFPNKENLGKLKFVDFPTRIFIAARSFEEFKKFRKMALSFNKKIKCAYWPIIKNSYWISPFSNNVDLTRLFEELEGCDCDLLIDLEMPLKNRVMILKNLFSFRKNKKIIKNFLEKNKKRIITAQSPPVFGLGLRRLFGLDYGVDVDVGLMFYTSTLKQNNVYTLFINRMRKLLKKIDNKECHNIGLGVIAKGILTTEDILSPKDLGKDLEFIKKLGFDRVVIFRLGGLNKEYMKVIHKSL